MPRRSQKRKNNQQQSTKNVSERVGSAILVENANLGEQDDKVADLSNAKSLRIDKSIPENLRTYLKAEITSELKGLILELEKELLKLLKPKSGGNESEENEATPENESRNFYIHIAT